MCDVMRDDVVSQIWFRFFRLEKIKKSVATDLEAEWREKKKIFCLKIVPRPFWRNFRDFFVVGGASGERWRRGEASCGIHRGSILSLYVLASFGRALCCYGFPDSRLNWRKKKKKTRDRERRESSSLKSFVLYLSSWQRAGL